MFMFYDLCGEEEDGSSCESESESESEPEPVFDCVLEDEVCRREATQDKLYRVKLPKPPKQELLSDLHAWSRDPMFTSAVLRWLPPMAIAQMQRLVRAIAYSNIRKQALFYKRFAKFLTLTYGDQEEAELDLEKLPTPALWAFQLFIAPNEDIDREDVSFFV
jgi:hypothetical protein